MRGALSFILAFLFAVPAAARGETARGRVRLNVMSYNIHVGIGMDKKLDLARIAEVIKQHRLSNL